jgi:hypothetical protein
MILLLVLVAERVSDEATQNFDRESFVFLVQGFPRVGFVEQKIEQVQIFFLQLGSPWSPAISCFRGETPEGD